ncbi:hypothetical protein KZC51_10825 [Microbacterium sp. SSW1-49]|uniref:DUF1127 domain-containing protein n=1 Tax=Microbacterium croceum TaxID=2851645 RepID=A0ABT0FEX6_9MICO|nr:hypothetical protein [Microbacterium croceum]MCK2036628.1 hypothetical protein [Microbacterium croceum]
MNTTLSHDTTHPPDTADRQVLHVPAPDELRRLSFADRLALRFGVWLLERAQRPRRRRRRRVTYIDPIALGDLAVSHRDSLALHSYDPLRQLR